MNRQLTLEDLERIEALPIILSQKSIEIYIIGCGGTGGFLAPNLCRMAQFLSPKRNLKIFLIDPDHVEPHNLHRQNFCVGELGTNKATALALRCGTVFSQIEIVAIPQSFESLSDNLNFNSWSNRGKSVVLIGCVDNKEARLQIEQVVRDCQLQPNQPDSLWWVDCGNDLYSGQILIGSSLYRKPKYYKLQPASCWRLPAPTLQMPDLLSVDTDNLELGSDIGLSCAQLTELGLQSLNINNAMAIHCAEIIGQLITNRLKRIKCEIDLLGGNVTSSYISQRGIELILNDLTESSKR